MGLFDDAQAGDRVFIVRRSDLTPATIDRVLSKSIEVAGCLYRRDTGRERDGDPWYPRRAAPATPENEERYSRQQSEAAGRAQAYRIVDRVTALVKNGRAVPDELQQILGDLDAALIALEGDQS